MSIPLYRELAEIGRNCTFFVLFLQFLGHFFERKKKKNGGANIAPASPQMLAIYGRTAGRRLSNSAEILGQRGGDIPGVYIPLMISNEKGRPNNGGNAQKYRLLCARVFWKDLLLLDAARSRSGRQGACRAAFLFLFLYIRGIISARSIRN